MALNVVINEKSKKNPAVLELTRDGDDVDLRVDGILVAYFDYDGVLQIAFPDDDELETLEDLGFAIDSKKGTVQIDNG